MTTTTFSIAASADDQGLTRYGTGWPPVDGPDRNSVDTALKVENIYGTATSTNYRTQALLSFNTASIPDTDVVTAATLRGYVIFLNVVYDPSLRGDWYAWDGTSASDFSNGDLDNNAVSGKALSTFVLNADNDIALSNPTNVSKTGLTKLRLGLPIGPIPPTNNTGPHVHFASFDHTTITEARLIVVHGPPDTTPPAAPTGLAATVVAP